MTEQVLGARVPVPAGEWVPAEPEWVSEEEAGAAEDSDGEGFGVIIPALLRLKKKKRKFFQKKLLFWKKNLRPLNPV